MVEAESSAPASRGVSVVFCSPTRWWGAFGVVAAAVVFAGKAVAADIADQNPSYQMLPYKSPPYQTTAYDWTGWYAGGHMGFVTGNSNWAAWPSGASDPALDRGSFDVTHSYNAFYGSGSWFGGMQVGFNRMFANRFVFGLEADVSATSWVDPNGHSIGGTSNVMGGAYTYGSNVMDSGTVRARVGYAAGSWLFYATGGLAWTLDQFTLMQTATGASESHFMGRIGWAAGAGIEAPLTQHWTWRLEYLHTGFADTSVNFPTLGQRYTSNLTEDQVRLGVNYRFGDVGGVALKDPPSAISNWDDYINIHGQFTATWQGYPPFHSAIPDGPKSLPAGGQGREIVDAGLFVGFRLWNGAEFWITPEVDQGNGLAGTTGAAMFPNGEAFKIGQTEPYTRLNRAFVRQTIDLGGATENVPADLMQFSGTQTSDRLVLTAGRFSFVDIFDTNKYANNPKSQFLNWAGAFNLPLDFGGDAWIYTWGAAAELYKDRFAFRVGYFDLPITPIGGNSPLSYGVDDTFKNANFVAEIEERHEIWGQPGKIKFLTSVDTGTMATYTDAIAWGIANNTAPTVDQARKYATKMAVAINVEQQIVPDLGFFARASWIDPRYEPFAGTDVNITASAGFSLMGTKWGRPDDNIGVMFATSYISSDAVAYLNAGGIGAVIGDGSLTHPGPERVYEVYYNYALAPSMGLTFDYQFFQNPAYNTDRGPVNLFATRYHWQF